MFYIQNYTENELLELLNGKIEISQKDNSNAYTRLFVVDANSIVKLYVSAPDLSKKNIENLLAMQNRADLYAFRELVMPTAIICVHGNILGYTMPYIHGCSFNAFLRDQRIPDKTKLFAFEQLAYLICKMPDGVYIGDLHGENILVDSDYRIHLIDIDGFSLEHGHQLTIAFAVPAISGKYIDANGDYIVSRNSDIYSFYSLFLTWLAGSPLAVGGYYKVRYVQYLEECGFSAEMISDIVSLDLPHNNTLQFSASGEILSNLHKYNYDCFLQETGLILTEEQAEETLALHLKKNERKIQ